MMKPLLFSLAALVVSFGAHTAQAQYITSPVTEAARNGPSGRLTPSVSGDAAQERIEALELRLSRMEQLLEAQRTLQARQNKNQALQLRQRLERLETRMSGLSSQSNGQANATALASNGASQGTVATTLPAAGTLSRLNDVTESLRALQAQTDSLMLEMRGLTERVGRGQADTEFRFQALESGVRRATAGISSTSDEPEVIGFVKRSAPVQGLEGASATGSNELPANAATTKLVGEGDLSVLAGFDTARIRPPLNDPKKLYQRALKDLQSGDYGGAQADFAQLVDGFPGHKLAGNAQYWLGETFYVRRQYKQAAQAFLVGYTTYAQSSKAPDSLLKLGMTLTALGEKKTGCDAFAELGAKFPDAPDAVAKRAQIERKRAGCVS